MLNFDMDMLATDLDVLATDRYLDCGDFILSKWRLVLTIVVQKIWDVRAKQKNNRDSCAGLV